MGALGHYLEEEGIATTQISLIREHTQAVQPPRALWVPFVLGRPLGAPNDAAFQTRVLKAVLRLLEAPSGPVLVDFNEEAPAGNDGEAGESFVCPVSFGSPTKDADIGEQVQAEMAELLTWNELAKKQRGRSTVGVSGLPPAAAAQWIVDLVRDPSTPVYGNGLERLPALRLAAHDVRAYYLESVSSQPGAKAAAQAEEWFWKQTAAGRLMFKLREMCLASPDDDLQRFGLRAVPTRFVPR